MTEYIDNFEITRKQELNELARIERSIVENMEASSKIVANFELPSVDEYMDIMKVANLKVIL